MELMVVIPRSTAEKEFVYPRIPVCSAFELCKSSLLIAPRGFRVEVEYGDVQSGEEGKEEEEGKREANDSTVSKPQKPYPHSLQMKQKK
jgi:hypothetical protein